MLDLFRFCSNRDDDPSSRSGRRARPEGTAAVGCFGILAAQRAGVMASATVGTIRGFAADRRDRELGG
jgi:hypothetical protein